MKKINDINQFIKNIINPNKNYPENFQKLHNYFSKIDKNLKYETIFNVYDPLDKKIKSYFELGILNFNFKKKYFFLVVYFNHLKIDFYLDKKHKLKKFPDRKKILDLVYFYFNKYFPKAKGDNLDDYGRPMYGSWGQVVNFTYKLKLDNYPLKHPLYLYSLSNRRKIEESFLSYPFTKINYNFGNKSLKN